MLKNKQEVASYLRTVKGNAYIVSGYVRKKKSKDLNNPQMELELSS